MNDVILYLSNYGLSLTVSILSIAAGLIGVFLSRKNSAKIGILVQDEFSANQYETYLDNSKKAIVNSTVSFGAEMCNSKEEADDLYSRTIIVGNHLLKDEGFKITVVRKV